MDSLLILGPCRSASAFTFSFGIADKLEGEADQVNGTSLGLTPQGASKYDLETEICD
jgi:hypothetical protein